MKNAIFSVSDSNGKNVLSAGMGEVGEGGERDEGGTK